jgi:hypothetical protein
MAGRSRGSRFGLRQQLIQRATVECLIIEDHCMDLRRVNESCFVES